MMLGSVGSLPGFCRGMSSVEAVADGKERIFRAIVAIEGERALRTVGLLAMVSRTIVQPRSPVAAAPDQYSLYGWVWQRYPKKLASFHCVYHLLACGPWANPLAQPLRRSRSEEHTSELQSLRHLVCRLLLEKKKKYRHRRLKCCHAVSVGTLYTRELDD